MNAGEYPACPECGSDDALPFEEENRNTGDPSMWIVVVSALIILGGYFLFALSSYLYFPLFVFILIVVVTRAVNRSEGRRKKKRRTKPQDYMCVDCGAFFRA
jgi:uncharacterized membrane protein YfcA